MKSTPCATCGHELNLREADLDKTLLCPKCGRMQIVHLLETTLLGAGEPKVDAEPNEQIRGDVISPVNAHGARSSDFLEGGVSPLGADPHLPQPSSTGRFDFLAPPQMNGEIGRLGGYRVLQQLGAGGMGVVFRAEDPLLQREVALKVMLPWVASNPQSRDRFLREAEPPPASNMRTSSRSIRSVRIEASSSSPCRSFRGRRWLATSVSTWASPIRPSVP